MDPASSNTAAQPLSHEQFIRLFLQAERELSRYVMALVPNVSDARDVVATLAVALAPTPIRKKVRQQHYPGPIP